MILRLRQAIRCKLECNVHGVIPQIVISGGVCIAHDAGRYENYSNQEFERIYEARSPSQMKRSEEYECLDV